MVSPQTVESVTQSINQQKTIQSVGQPPDSRVSYSVNQSAMNHSVSWSAPRTIQLAINHSVRWSVPGQFNQP